MALFLTIFLGDFIEQVTGLGWGLTWLQAGLCDLDHQATCTPTQGGIFTHDLAIKTALVLAHKRAL